MLTRTRYYKSHLLRRTNKDGPQKNGIESLDCKFKDGYFKNPSLNCYVFFSLLSYLLGYTADPSFSPDLSFSSLIVALYLPFSLSFSLSGRGRHGWMWTTSFTPMTSPPHVPPPDCHVPHLCEQLACNSSSATAHRSDEVDASCAAKRKSKR